MNPVLARIKLAVIEVIGHCGNIDGAAATAKRKRSAAGDWHNLNEAIFPPLDCALALDQVAIAGGKEPPIVTALARELGGMFVPHIDACADEGTAPAMVLQIAEQLGALSGDVARALANDGVIDSPEAKHALLPLEGLMRKATQLNALLASIRDANVIGPATKGGK